MLVLLLERSGVMLPLLITDNSVQIYILALAIKHIRYDYIVQQPLSLEK